MITDNEGKVHEARECVAGGPHVAGREGFPEDKRFDLS